MAEYILSDEDTEPSGWLHHAPPAAPSQPQAAMSVPRTLAPNPLRETTQHRTTRSGPVLEPSSKYIPQRRRRQRNRLKGEPGDDHDDKASESSSSTHRNLESCEQGVSWACPFFKKDPWKHHRCLGNKLGKISYVKQHLYRCHSTPKEYCQTCFEEFQSSKHAEQHMLCGPCQPRTCPFMSNKQRNLVQDTTARMIHESDKWYQIWDILYPNEPRPESPLMDHVCIEVMHSYRKFCQGRGKEIVPELLYELGVPESTVRGLGDSLADRILERIQDASLAIYRKGSNPCEGAEMQLTRHDSVSASSSRAPKPLQQSNAGRSHLGSGLLTTSLGTIGNSMEALDEFTYETPISESSMWPGVYGPTSPPILPSLDEFDDRTRNAMLHTRPLLADTDMSSPLRLADTADYFSDMMDESRELSPNPWHIPG
jgi:hypothetical protein